MKNCHQVSKQAVVTQRKTGNSFSAHTYMNKVVHWSVWRNNILHTDNFSFV